MAQITAQRGGEKRTFSLSIWQTMPVDKYGWKQCADVPEVVAEKKMQLAKDATPEDYAAQLEAARKTVTAANEKYQKAVEKNKNVEKALADKDAAEAKLKELLNAKAD